MRPPEQVEHVARLVAQGDHDREIARLTGIPRTTVRDWRRTGRRGQARCPRCDAARSLLTPQYAYLLGLYLGDGYIARSARVWQLRIYLDTRYPKINAAALAAMRAVRGGRVAVVPRAGCVAVSSYWKHWPCVLPQHGTRLQVEWRVMNQNTISVARRDSVAKLDAYIGPKR